MPCRANPLQAVHAHKPARKDPAMLRILLFALAFLTSALPAHATVPALPGLGVSPAKGDAPLAVTIDGPPDLLKMIDACTYRSGWVTPFVLIDWGDGNIEPRYRDKDKQGQSCAHVKTHVYTAPGNYKITARMGHLGPTDAPVTDWQGNAVITVTGEAKTPTTIQLLEPVPGQSFRYQEPSQLRWKLTTGQPVDIVATLLARDGTVLATGTSENIAYNGEGQTALPLSGNEAYESALLANNGPYTVTLAALAKGVSIAQAQAKAVQLTPLLPAGIRNASIAPAEGGNAPLNVKLAYNYFHEHCFSYDIDWGDGSAHSQQVRDVRKQCALKSGTLKVPHVYWKAGTFTIRIRTNNIDPFKPLSKISAYEELRITVK